ncbi:hypothetical protein CAC01_22180 [Streptomyces sp. CLI2509]|nr:hypothetical protein CAC01_22180 [Streptomyces sp. CLI2509]
MGRRAPGHGRSRAGARVVGVRVEGPGADGPRGLVRVRCEGIHAPRRSPPGAGPAAGRHSRTGEFRAGRGTRPWTGRPAGAHPGQGDPSWRPRCSKPSTSRPRWR